MKRAQVSAASLIAIFVALATPATAQCRLSLQPVQDQWVMRYDPLVDTLVEREFDVAAINQGETPCVGQVDFDLRGSPFGLSLNGAGGERVAYALVDRRASTDVTPRAGGTVRRPGARSVTLAPGERQLLRFSFAARGDELLSAGDYTQTVFLSVEDAQGLRMAEQPVVLNIQVPSVAVMGLKGEFRRSNGVARIDLGELTRGERDLNTSLYVMSTGGYAVSISSANGGRLRQGAGEWAVDYGLALGRRPINLQRGDRIDKPSRRWQSDDYPLTLTIGEVSGRRAGEYTDTLTFTIAAI